MADSVLALVLPGDTVPTRLTLLIAMVWLARGNCLIVRNLV